MSPVLEEPDVEIDGITYPPNYANPNLNEELDNLYLDMNGIVHPCTHPEGREAPKNEDEMMLEVFKYTDHVLTMARPRKILMIAIDGVAPRAKMNQQRSRRFRTARESRISAEAKEEAINEAEARGEIIDDAIKGKTRWDSNVITPGTPFMDTLAISLRYWIAYKFNSDPGWKDLKIIISDASVPGEGEHKIMEFIRSQRADPSHDPNTTHCIYGLDADLIFLGLATHEPHFKILREDVFAQQNKGGSGPNKNFGLTEEDKRKLEIEAEVDKSHKKPFIWLHVDILRQYLEVELAVNNLPFPYDFERAIDDWVFMCFFCGNDFLPHLPSLDVRSNSIDMLTDMWRRNLGRIKGFITCDGVVDLGRAQVLLQSLGQQEDNIFRSKIRSEEDRKKRRLDDERHKERKEMDPKLLKEMLQKQEHDFSPAQRLEETVLDQKPQPEISKNRTGDRAPVRPLDNIPLYSPSGESVGAVHMSNSELVAKRNEITLANIANKSAAEAIKAKLKKPDQKKDNDEEDDDDEDTEATPQPPVKVGAKRGADGFERREDVDQYADPVRLGEPGYRDRYYTLKFDAPESNPERRRDIVERYIEGVSWVLLYYYQGCPSWNWYFPYHYAPFAVDFVNLDKIDIKFNKGEPFRPYEQLMSVLPASSGHTLPEIFRPLMSSPTSEIIDFYPEDFHIDLNGKKFEWQGVAILPFIDEDRLLKAVRSKYDQLTENETARNARKNEILIVSGKSVLYEEASKKISSAADDSAKFSFRAFETGGLTGTIYKDTAFDGKKIFNFPLSEGHMPDVPLENNVLFLNYDMPKTQYKNKSMLLSGVKLRDPVFTPTEETVIRQKTSDRRSRNHNGNSLQGNNALGRNEHLKVAGRVGGFNNFLGLERTGQFAGADLQTQQGFRGSFNSGGGGNHYNNSYQNGGGRGGYQNRQNRNNQYNNNGGGGYRNNPYNNGNGNGNRSQYNNYNNNRQRGYQQQNNQGGQGQGQGHGNNGYNQYQQQFAPTANSPFSSNAFGSVGRNYDQNNEGRNNNNNYNNHSGGYRGNRSNR